MASATPTTMHAAMADVASINDHSYVYDMEYANVIGAHTAPANDAIDIAPINDSHVSECTEASHLSACTAETQVSTITEDSMLNPEPLQETVVILRG
jgi:hypothetical protein